MLSAHVTIVYSYTVLDGGFQASFGFTLTLFLLLFLLLVDVILDTSLLLLKPRSQNACSTSFRMSRLAQIISQEGTTIVQRSLMGMDELIFLMHTPMAPGPVASG